MTTEINLQQFCGDDAYAEKHELNRPFSADGLTWATDERIVVRVPARAEYGPQKKPIGIGQIAKIIDQFDGAFTPLSQFTLPDFKEESGNIECTECDGCGTEHNCPSCECECDECGGTGFVETVSNCSCEIFGAVFNIKYLRMVFALPNVRAGVPNTNMMVFRFDGGDGALMGMRGWYSTHHVLAPRAEAAE